MAICSCEEGECDGRIWRNGSGIIHAPSPLTRYLFKRGAMVRGGRYLAASGHAHEIPGIKLRTAEFVSTTQRELAPPSQLGRVGKVTPIVAVLDNRWAENHTLRVGLSFLEGVGAK